MDTLKQPPSACGPECGCHATVSSGRTRRVIGAVVLVAAAALVVRAVTKDRGAANEKTATGFTVPANTAQSAAPDVAFPATTNGVGISSDDTVVGEEIDTLAVLNTVVAKMDAVFVYLPGKSGTSGKAPSAPIMGAAKTIESQGRTVGVFTLKPESGDYSQMSTQVVLPAVVAFAKGGRMARVSGDVTETRIVQAFLQASSAKACAPGKSCGPSGCK